ncbi:MAG: TIGR00730 family Rossman fold protein [Burkholderiales bacterium]|nr:TIGR00730 family Rossman fold protein [Burkholderiales bacterium]
MNTPNNSRAYALCIYCGSRMGNLPSYGDAAAALGHAIGKRGWAMVYGGGKVGLMGTVADAALAAGADVTGIIPDGLMRREVGHPGLTRLEVVDSMHTRKQRMAELADAFVALPGGIGTLEELFEVWTWQHLGYHAKPVALLNVGGYYDGLLSFMRQVLASGFIDQGQHDLLIVDDNIERLLDRLAAATRPGTTSDYGHI